MKHRNFEEMNRLIVLLCLFLPLSLWGQLTLKVIEWPVNTPEDAQLFVAGDFNGWEPSQPAFQLVKINDEYVVELDIPAGTYEYKFMLESWDNPEGDDFGDFAANRTLEFDGTAQVIEHSISSWENINAQSTANNQVTIISEEFYIPELDRTRRVWIYLPPAYGIFIDSYPVLYMQDGQNLFDNATSFAGEWCVDESLFQFDQLAQGIVVGIDNGGAQRVDEYAPWANEEYGGGEGDAYIQFIMNTLKPYIDANYLTKPDRDNTGIGGSSLGGLISLYAGIEYPEVFGKLMIFSPAFWFNPELFDLVEERGFEQDLRIYMMSGGLEGGTVSSDMLDMELLLLEQGFLVNDLLSIVISDGEHSEWFWKREFADAFYWLFGEQEEIFQTGVEANTNSAISLYPSPASNHLSIDGLDTGQTHRYAIYDISGRLLKRDLFQEQISLVDLQSGLFLLTIENEKGNLVASRRFVKEQ